MLELKLLALPIQRFFRDLGRLGEISWLLLASVVVFLGLVSYSSFNFGAANPGNLPTIFTYILTISLATGLWLGYAKMTGEQPTRWRLVSRTAWFFVEQSRGLFLLLVTALVTAVSFGAGTAITNGLSWWATVFISVLLLLLIAGVTIYNCALGVLVRVISQNIFVRLLLLLLVSYGSVLIIGWLGPLIAAISTSWEPSSNSSLLLTALLAIGLLGTAIAVAELVLPHHHIKVTLRRRYWPLRLPTSNLGGFGAGTAIFVSEIAYYLRSASLQRRFLASIATLGLGLVTLNLFSPNYSQNAGTLFYVLIALVISLLSITIGRNTGQAAETRVTKYRGLPVASSKIRLAFLAASLSATVVVAALLIELFAATVATTYQLVLLAEIAVAINIVSFSFGQLGVMLKNSLNDPLLPEVLSAVLVLLAVIMAGIILLFTGVVAPVTTGLVIAIWAVGVWLVASRQRQKANAN